MQASAAPLPHNTQSRPVSRPALLGLALLSAASLAFELNLARLFSTAQFYHFAFMVVSIALLGFGASGTLLAVIPLHRRPLSARRLAWLGFGSGAGMLGAYLFTNWLPFDSFSIAWDRRQALLLVLHYLALALPFFCAGLATGVLLEFDPAAAGRTYAANLLGSAIGCLAALGAPAWLGGEGTVLACAACCGLAGWFFPAGEDLAPGVNREQRLARLGSASLLLLALLDGGRRISGLGGLPWTALKISPYKSFSYTIQAPEARLIAQQWNAYSRVDLVSSPSIHSLPGLSYRNPYPAPLMDGVLVDGDDLSPLINPQADLRFTGQLPAAAAYGLRPGARALILEPRAGLDILTALAQGASRVTAVEPNALIRQAAGRIYTRPEVETVGESGRSFLRGAAQDYDVIVVSLISAYHPVRSGAYSLAEDYRYTVEAFQDALKRLAPGGLLLATRWLQTPPSEELRLLALAVEAAERQGFDPQASLFAFRGYNTLTVLLKRGAFTAEELAWLRAFCAGRAFDLVTAPDLQPEETNRYNILPQPVYAAQAARLLPVETRRDYYANYPYQVDPPTDDRPFFGHYFKWAQAGEVLTELGRTWQPFGGAGYFVMLAVLLLALGGAAGLIGIPALAARRQASAVHPAGSASALAYFVLIGAAYMLVEIPLMQRLILFLGQPAYAFAVALFSLLLFSGLGSRFSLRLSLEAALLALAGGLFLLPWLLPWVLDQALGMGLLLRLGLAILLLAPLGFLMGAPFPAGLRRLAQASRGAAPVGWVWAANGAASVVASVLAALLALSWGFSWVLRLGALAYLGAWLALKAPPRFPRLRR
jgi:hypothetical protein